MQVTVELFSHFRENRFEEATLEVPAEASVADLLDQLKIPLADVGVIVVNSASGTVKKRLRAGDKVTLIPIIGGG